MKRGISIIISFIVVFLLLACGKKDLDEIPFEESSEEDFQDENKMAGLYTVTINVDGIGEVAYMQGNVTDFTDDDYFQSAQINLAEVDDYTISARTTEEGWSFVKWLKDGEDYTVEPTFILTIDESADFRAVFEFFDGEVEIDYGTSDIYSKEDMDSAIQVIMDEFNSWGGYEMHSIRYVSDDCNSEENIEWLNSHGDGNDYTECIEFVTDYRTPLDDKEAITVENNCIYKDYEWWLARTSGGNWILVDSGYC